MFTAVFEKGQVTEEGGGGVEERRLNARDTR